VQGHADALLARLGLEGSTEQESTARIQRAYRILYQREATPKGFQRGPEFLRRANLLFQAAAAEPQKPHRPNPFQENQGRRRRVAACPSLEDGEHRRPLPCPEDDPVAAVHAGAIELGRILLRELRRQAS
jgi:hypothetical protein